MWWCSERRVWLSLSWRGFRGKATLPVIWQQQEEKHSVRNDEVYTNVIISDNWSRGQVTRALYSPVTPEANHFATFLQLHIIRTKASVDTMLRWQMLPPQRCHQFGIIYCRSPFFVDLAPHGLYCPLKNTPCPLHHCGGTTGQVHRGAQLQRRKCLLMQTASGGSSHLPPGRWGVQASASSPRGLLGNGPWRPWQLPTAAVARAARH